MPAKKKHDDSSQILALLTGIDARLSALEEGVQGMSQMTQLAPDAIATVTDTFDGMVSNWAEQGVDLDERLCALAKTIESLSNPAFLKMLRVRLERSPELDPMLISILDAMKTAQKTKGPCNIQECLTSFREVGRSIAFLFRFLRILGQSLKQHSSTF